MALVRAQNVTEIAVKHLHETTEVVNVWHIRHDEFDGGSDEETVRVFADAYQEFIVPVLTNNVTLVGFSWVSLDPDDLNAGDMAPDPALPDVGEQVGAALPPNVAGLVHKNTPNRPRGRRDGRAYIAGIREGDIDSFGDWTTPALTTWNNALSNFFAEFDTDDASGVLLLEAERRIVVLETTPESRAPGNQEVIIGSRRVSSLTMRRRVATQRERLR